MSSNITYHYNSDLLLSKAQVIAQQCNCTSKKSAGLALSIIKKYPHGDFYSKRASPSKPGSIKLAGNRKNQRFILAMFAQLNPGKPSIGDSSKQREKWFDMCLEKISEKCKRIKSIAFPFNIGCGLAGGNWKHYEDMINKWAVKNPNIKIHIVSQDPEVFLKNIRNMSDSKLARLRKKVNSEYNKRDRYTCIYGSHRDFYWVVTIKEDDMSGDRKEIRKWLVESFDIDLNDSFVETALPGNGVKDIENEALKGVRKYLKFKYSDLPDFETLQQRHGESEGTEGDNEKHFKMLFSKSEKSHVMHDDISYKDMTLKEYTLEHMPKGWEKFFDFLIENDGIDTASEFLEKEIKKGETIYPPLNEIYTVFDQCSLKNIKVLVIGQDPYHTPGAAMGVAFGHHPNRSKIQSSLQNIYKELEREGFRADWSSGDLTKWVQQGVFLINTALTVRKGQAGSHTFKRKTEEGPWEYFIDQVFRKIATKERLIVVMWGGHAAGFKDRFTKKGHIKLFSSHPSGFSWKNGPTPFWESNVFLKINKQLKKWGEEKIDFSLV